MENIEIIIITLILIAIVFKILKIIKYFIVVIVLVVAFNLFGGFNHPSLQSFNEEYGVSEKISNINDSLGLKGLVQDLWKKISQVKDKNVDEFICEDMGNTKQNIENKFKNNHELIKSDDNIKCK